MTESMGNPAENQQEAGESLSHTEKSYFQKHEAAIGQLMSKV